MAVTQEQHQNVLDKITDLRVIVTELAGKIDLTNERVNNTNDRMDTLITHLEEQAKQTALANQQTLRNRKWIITTAIGVTGLLIAVVGLFIRSMI